jgi:hypothetical protein
MPLHACPAGMPWVGVSNVSPDTSLPLTCLLLTWLLLTWLLQVLGIPRVALLFLTKGELFHEPTWRLWFKSGGWSMPGTWAPVGHLVCWALPPAGWNKGRLALDGRAAKALDGLLCLLFALSSICQAQPFLHAISWTRPTDFWRAQLRGCSRPPTRATSHAPQMLTWMRCKTHAPHPMALMAFRSSTCSVCTSMPHLGSSSQALAM